jgi:MinD superfamily P-loop ATPase
MSVREIVVISGKGGTGKTSVVASFAALAENAVLADCDVDAADLHLVLSPHIKERREFSGGKGAEILPEKCTGCGKCFDLCRFDAIHEGTTFDEFPKVNYRIDAIGCEGCGVCAWFCPEKAIEFNDMVNGEWFISDTRYGPMVHAKLGIAEENSGKLVTLVRKEAKKIAEDTGRSYIIVDGSPGIGCPVIASIGGSNLVLIVSEPTLSGEHDLERVAELAKHFGIPAMVCINKYDINRDMTKRIEEKSKGMGLALAGNIRYDNMVTKAQIAEASVVEYTNLPVADDISNVWRNVVGVLKNGGTEK